MLGALWLRGPEPGHLLQADVSTGKISAADGGTLRGAIHAVQAALGTCNRFLEWWRLGA
jgi:hypothetical protein